MNQTVKQMTSFIVMDILERVEKMRAEGVSDIISMEVGEPISIFHRLPRVLSNRPCGDQIRTILTRSVTSH